MVLEELLKLKRITIEDVEMYQLFSANEIGQRWLRRNMLETFLEEPPKEHLTGELCAFIDGRRSFIRQLHYGLEQIHKLIGEFQNDNIARG